MRARFSAPVQTGPEAHPASCTMGTGSFPGVSCGRGVTLTSHPVLVPRSKIETVIPLISLRALVAYERVKPTYKYKCMYIYIYILVYKRHISYIFRYKGTIFTKHITPGLKCMISCCLKVSSTVCSGSVTLSVEPCK